MGLKPDDEEAKLKENIFNCGQWPNIYLGLPLFGKEYYGFLDSYRSFEKMKEDSSLGVINILLRGSIYSSTSYSHKSQTFTSPLTVPKDSLGGELCHILLIGKKSLDPFLMVT